MDLHELTAGYALDALDPAERERYEAHLGSCERCREDLQDFWQVTGSLARAAGGPQPPASLRARILEQARAERQNVVPLRRRWAVPVLSGAAAVAAVAALALGIWGTSVSRYLVPVVSSAAAVAAVAALALGLWATSLSGRLDDAEGELAVLSDPNARVIETEGGEANLVVTPSGDAALVVRKLAPAPPGKDYEIWVIDDGVPRSAGLFERPGVAVLSRPVDAGQTVAVTLEQDGGVEAPTTDPLFTASRA
jgi:anti-sigma factor RsiW